MSIVGCTRAFRLLLVLTALGRPGLAAEPLRVALVAPDAPAAASLAPLQDALEATGLLRATRATADLAALRPAGAVLLLRGPGALAPADAARLREFFQSGRGGVILGATRDAWSAVPSGLEEVLGATPAGPFAEGAPMTVINLFPHPVFAGITRFETDEPATGWKIVADDVQLIMEGTVGEETAPLGWVRRRAAGRIVHLLPSSAATLRDPAYQRMVVNALLWSARRPVPGATPAVQRTFMPDSHPGALAITFPEGPGVCLDPVRGGINYVWDGDFVDLRPRWLTKQGAPARLFGEVFYTEKLWQPLRAGSPTDDTALRFRGYTLHDGVPEFHYEVGGRAVHETITALPGGTGIQRRFRVAAGTRSLWLRLEPQTGAEIVAAGLERDGDQLTYAAADAGEFTITLRRRTGGATP